jgi:hypothetical protein
LLFTHPYGYGFLRAAGIARNNISRFSREKGKERVFFSNGAITAVEEAFL